MSEILQEKWMKGVAVTTTVLAVATAVAAGRAGVCVSKNQILTAQEGSQWAYYQAKSIKQNLAESQLEAFEVAQLGITKAEQKGAYENRVADLRTKIARYDKEKAEIKDMAEKTGAENRKVNRQGNQFALAVVLFQIAIVLSSVSALLKRPAMWYAGVAFSIVAILYAANGFFLFF
ncbi:MAG: DUF4337 domain-containing protein [Candidatus Omnitrophica bacterium]|nr:DUF4337 domain-containing protein [Candidatus Omnitrophota bacterium]